MNETIRTQLTHRTIREFTSDAVPADVLDTLFDVAVQTPSSRALQQTGIIHVTDQSVQDELAELGRQEYVRRAPVYLMFIIDAARNAAILAEAGRDPAAAGSTKVFVEAFTDACLTAQNVAVAAESMGLGVNYLGNIHNDTARVIELLGLPRYTFPVVGMTLGYPNQDPQLKPRIPRKFRVMRDRYTAPDNWTAALADYDAEMTTYYDLRNANQREDSFTNQVYTKLTTEPRPQDKSLDAARAQGFRV